MTVGTGRDAVTFTTCLVSPDATTAGWNLWGRDLNCQGSNPGYCTCVSSVDHGFWPAGSHFRLQTAWNFDYSTVWTNMANSVSATTDGGPLWFTNVSYWTSGAGTACAYSDGIGTLMDGYGWISIKVRDYHLYHQVDAWGNCTAFYWM